MLKFSAFLSCVAFTKCVKFQIPMYKGLKVGIFRISPIEFHFLSCMWSKPLERDNLCITEDKTNQLKVNRITRYILLLTLAYLVICKAVKLYD